MFQGRQQPGGLVTLVEAAVGDMATVDPLLMLVMQVAVAALVYFLIGQLALSFFSLTQLLLQKVADLAEANSNTFFQL